MRILHTSDWHMNDTLRHIDRSPDICRVLEQIAAYLQEYRVDVMLVTGDLFSERSRPEQMRQSVADLKRIFSPFLARGGTIVAISGNHDSEIFFETLRDAFDLVTRGQGGHNENDMNGRLYIFARPYLLTLTDPGGARVQFVLMPYPTPSCYLRGERIRYQTIEEKHRAIQQAFTHVLQGLEAKLDHRLPSVLASHIHVRGSHVHSLFRLSEEEDVIFEPSDIPTHWAYVAYGHIHKPQAPLNGASHVRYAGSIERLDIGERDDDKSVILCEVGPTGLVAEPTLLPLHSTPLYRIEITDPDIQVPQLSQAYPDADRALVHYTLHWQPGKHNRDALCQAIHTIFPRWYSRELREIGRENTSGAPFRPQHIQDVIGTVRDYLTMRLSTNPQREALLALADTLLAEEPWR